MENLKISIIVPYKNAGRWIRRCAGSLTRQEGNFKFIFVNDDSEDDGAEILKTYEDNRFVLLYNSNEAGPGGARNSGLENAEGDWITFLDADDELLPGAWDKYMKMINGANADIHQANHLRHSAVTGKTIRKYENPDGIYNVPALPEMWAPVWNKIYKAELVQDIRFQDLRFGEDEMFNVACLEKAGRIHNTAVDIIQHNLENPESLSRTKRATDLKNLLQALVEEITWAGTPQMKRAIYNTIIQHMEAGWFQKIICGE